MFTFKLTQDPQWVMRSDGLLCRVDLLLAQEHLAGGGTFLPMDASDYAAEKAAVLAQARELRDKIFSRLNGIQQDLEWNRFKGVLTDAQAIPQIDGIMAAKTGLKDVVTYPTVAAATTGAETTVALKVRYDQLVTELRAVSLYACTAFNGLDV